MVSKQQAIKSDIARLMGDPNDMDFNFSEEEKRKLTPYQRSKDSNDPTDQFSELVTCRVDGQLKRLIEEEVSLLRPFYRTTSDFVRDAIFKWTKFLHENYLAPGNPVEPLVLKLDMIARQASETAQRRDFVQLISAINGNLHDLILDNAIEKLAEETAEYAEHINEITDTYWKTRAIREFVEMPVFPSLLRLLRGDPTYQNSGLVKLLETWGNQKIKG